MNIFRTPSGVRMAVSQKRRFGLTQSKSLHDRLTRISHALAELQRAEQQVVKLRKIYHGLVRGLLYKEKLKNVNVPLKNEEKMMIRRMANYSKHFRSTQRTLRHINIPRNLKGEIFKQVTASHIR